MKSYPHTMSCLFHIGVCWFITSAVDAEPLTKLVPRKAPQLAGVWQRSSASFQVAGGATWQFSPEGKLAVETQHLGGKIPTDRPTVKVTRADFRYAVDASKLPHRLTTFVINDRGEQQVVDRYAVEFRGPELWMCRDYGQEIEPGTFVPGGKHEWVMGFTPVDSEPLNTETFKEEATRKTD